MTTTEVTGINFLGEAVFGTGFQLGGTEVGGISGLVYDENNQVYYAISDDRSQNAPARFYNVTIDLSDGSLEDGDVEFVGERTLLDGSGNPFPEGGIDPEGIALTSAGTLFISSEGNANNLLAPFVNEFSLEGEQLNQLPVPEKFLPTEDGTSGIRNNQAFESLTITPDERFLYTAVENALIQDGPASSLDSESAVRIIEYNLETGEPSGEFIYINDRIPVAPEPADSFADNGLVELLALDNSGTFLALERSFAMGVGNNLRLYEIQLQGATDVRDFDSLLNPDPEEELFDVDAVASKRLLLDFGELGIQLDNSQALAFGPTLDNGNQSLIVVSDNNFNESQITQFLAFELEFNNIPAVTAAVETPPEIRFGDPENPDPNNAPDSDDPAIYLHPTDSGESIVITTVKNGGLRVYDLEGNELQRIAPDGIRYNNVDLVYDFSLGETTVDLAVASDRANDTLAIFQIDPNTRQLTDITAGSLSDAAISIFGIDNGEQTAYGLATYTSLVSDESYVFVSQADGNQVAQLELVDNGSGAVDATVVRTLTVPVPPEADLEDAQVEGMVVDRELGFLYVGQEDFGIWKFSAEPDAGDNAFDPSDPEPNSLINGVASGDTTQDSTVLWTRSTFLGDVTFEYSTDEEFNNIIGTETATVTDVTLPVKVEIDNLTPGTDYYYRVTDAAGATATGEFETAQEVGTQAGLTFGVSGDWRGELTPYPAIGNVAEQDLAFFVALGDTIYANRSSDAVKNEDGTRSDQAETIEEYRAKHSEVYGSRLGLNSWAEVRASTSILAITDDNEIIDNFAGGALASSDDPFVETEGLINDTQLYENGLQAFQEYNPLRNEFYGETGDEITAGERQLYRYNTYGSDAAVILLDNRSFRDETLVAADLSNPEDVGRFLAESLTLDRTMLGEAQLEDLKQDLLAAENDGITWKFVMVPEPIQNFGPQNAQDRFEGYAVERAEILSFINENDIDNVVFVTADIHGTVVNNLTYQEQLGGEQIATNAFEVITGAVAYDPPLGPTLVGRFLDEQTQAIYNSLPINSDSDSIPDDRDDFIKLALNDNFVDFGYDPIGLNDNLDIAEGLIDATLVQGDYIATHTYGWTKFDIDEETQQLTVTTYGIDSYSEEELLANPEEILNQTPAIVSQFTVDISKKENIANGEFPEAVNTITDFEPGIDVIGIGGALGIAAVDVSFNPVEGGVIIAAGGNNLAELLGVDASLLSAADVDGNIIIA